MARQEKITTYVCFRKNVKKKTFQNIRKVETHPVLGKYLFFDRKKREKYSNFGTFSVNSLFPAIQSRNELSAKSAKNCCFSVVFLLFFSSFFNFAVDK